MPKLLIMLFFLSASLAPASADIAEKNEQLAGVQSKIKQLISNIGLLSKKKQTLIQQLAILEKQYGKTATAIKQLQKQLQDNHNKQKQFDSEINQQQHSIDKQLTGLESQVRTAYAMGRSEKLKLLLNQQDPALSSRMMVYYDYFNTARLNKLDAIQHSLQNLNQLKYQNKLRTQQLESLKIAKQQEHDTQLQTKQQRDKLLAQIKQQFASKEQQLKQLQESEKKLQQLITSLQQKSKKNKFNSLPRKPFAQLRGQLPWPVQGKLLKSYGSKRANSNWDGVLIEAKEGAEIHAISEGKVAYADWLRGYGLLVIIDHGQGYMTLYAFNQSLDKQVGNHVKAGELIAFAGNSDGRTQSGLYFGIRKNGKPVNPVKWCKKLPK